MSNTITHTVTATVSLIHTASGAARMVVRVNGRQKSVPMDYSASDPFAAALVEVLGEYTEVEHTETAYLRNTKYFLVDVDSIRPIVPDYTLTTYADGYGVWHCRIDFTYGAGNTGEGERLISNARTAATRAIRRELLDRGMSPNFRLSYKVTANKSAGSGALLSLTISEW